MQIIMRYVMTNTFIVSFLTDLICQIVQTRVNAVVIRVWFLILCKLIFKEYKFPSEYLWSLHLICMDIACIINSLEVGAYPLAIFDWICKIGALIRICVFCSEETLYGEDLIYITIWELILQSKWMQDSLWNLSSIWCRLTCVSEPGNCFGKVESLFSCYELVNTQW